MLMQAATSYRPAKHQVRNYALAIHFRDRLTFSNVVRLALATMALVAIPIDLNQRVFSPAPNWSLIAIEPVVLIAFLRCTLGSIR